MAALQHAHVFSGWLTGSCLRPYFALALGGCALWVGSIRDLHAAPAAGESDSLTARLRAQTSQLDRWEPVYRPIYRAILPWYEAWGLTKPGPVDPWAVEPDIYASELADSLESGRNFVAEHVGAAFPLVWKARSPELHVQRANYLLHLPEGFGVGTKRYPLVIGLHGSGWLGHKISFSRGDGTCEPVFRVTPIDEEGPWQIDFLNAYLDDLLTMLPIDPDRVYVEGHSLGGIATWEWAMHNPERFAAISPHSARGGPFRAVRLKYVPSWVIHGQEDDVISSGFAEQMVSALHACGAPVVYSPLEGVPHNMPSDLDDARIVAWYLKQTRSSCPAPADPVESLGLNAAGVSPFSILERDAEWGWFSPSVHGSPWEEGWRQTERKLMRTAQATGRLIDSPVREQWTREGDSARLWLSVPGSLRRDKEPPADAIERPSGRVARFYFRGARKAAFTHARDLEPELRAAGFVPSARTWVTVLSARWGSDEILGEFWIEEQSGSGSAP